MKKAILPFLMSTLISTTAFAADAHKEHAHWGYDGASGPEHWSELDDSYGTCGSGRNQSPVDLNAMTEADLAPVTFSYKAGGESVVNNGHTIQVNYTPGSTISIDGKTFELKQFHFHSPSENTIKGKSFPLEAHFVHADQDGNLAVVAVMFEEGKFNPELEKAWAAMPDKAGDSAQLEVPANAASLMPAAKDYYRFNGSLTTPPCSEGVRWIVLKQYATASKAQIEKFTHVLGHANNRPVQPLNARPVLQ